MKRSFKDYTVYFLTLVIGVAVFYMFNSLGSQKATMELSNVQRASIDNMEIMMSYVSVFVAVVLGILIVYANQFLIKRRKKEFGIYLTLGMNKFTISEILLLETMLVGFASLIVGLLLGVFLSQLMSVIVAKTFEANMTKFTFVFSTEAFTKTWIYFAVIYLISVLLNAVLVSRYKLISLLKAEHKQNTEKVINPVVSVIGFVIGCGALVYVYHYFVWEANGLFRESREYFLSQVLQKGLVAVVATFLIFWSLSGVVMAVATLSKKIYLRGTNMFVIRQLGSRIHTTVIGMSLICLMLFVTVTMLSISFSLTYAMNKEVNDNARADMALIWYFDTSQNQDEDRNKELNEIHSDIYKAMEKAGFDMSGIAEYAQANSAYPVGFSLLDYYDEDVRDIVAQKQYDIDKNAEDFEAQRDEALNTSGLFYRQSEYNKLAKIYGLDEIDLAEDEYTVVASIQDNIGYYDTMLSRGKTINIKGKELKPKGSKAVWGIDYISSTENNYGFFVVPDSIEFDKDEYSYAILAANYDFSSGRSREELDTLYNPYQNAFLTEDYDGAVSGSSTQKAVEATEKLMEQSPYEVFYVSTKGEIVQITVTSNTVLIFLSMYIGVVFLLTSAAVLALKQLSDSADNKERYTILRRIGCDERMINSSLFRQIMIFFMLPMILALIHSGFAIASVIQYIGVYFDIATFVISCAATFALIVVIYSAYFIATYFCSKGIIKDNK